MGRDCQQKGMKRKGEDFHGGKFLKKKKEQTHEAKEETKSKENAMSSMQEPKGIGFIEEVTFENTEGYNYDPYNSSVYANDEHLSYYNWLADTATTLHVTNS